MSVIDIAKSHFENLGVQSIEVPEWKDEHGNSTIIYWNPINLSEKNILFKKSDNLSDVSILADILVMKALDKDGKKLFNIMLKSKEYLIVAPTWQYIIFKYNEDHMEQAKQMATDNNINILFVYSSKWLNEDDPLRPSEKNHFFNHQYLIRPKGGFEKKFNQILVKD